jgi:hypothetical protein
MERDVTGIFDRPVRDMLYHKVQRLERETSRSPAKCDRDDSNFSYGRRVPRHVKVPLAQKNPRLNS